MDVLVGLFVVGDVHPVQILNPSGFHISTAGLPLLRL